MKCATTSLCDILAAHADVFMSAPKEPDFFCDDTIFQRGCERYEALFVAGAGKVAIGEGSTGYTKERLHPHVAERVAKYLPKARLIYIVRHPLKRIESHWLHLVACGENVPPLRGALQKWPHIVDTSLYWKQISAYRALFPGEQILVLFFEDFVTEPVAVINRCYEFLGVNPKRAGADPSQPSHVSADVRLDGSVICALRRFPVAHAVKKLVPGVARAIMPTFRKPLPERPEWPVDLRGEVSNQLIEDTLAFLKFYGKPADFWQLE